MPASFTTYSKKARSVAEYTKMRGVTDFTNAAQFNVFETGYSFLCVLSVPEYLRQLSDNEDVKKMLETFVSILENEFRGLDGIPDLTAENLEYTDGISTMSAIGKVTEETDLEVSMNFTEKTGGVITKFIDYYLRGIKDPRTQARTYHGLIKDGKLAAGFENEVFNFLYIVTDSTMLNIEKAYVLANAWPNKAENSIYNSTKGEIDKKEITVTFKCFMVSGEEVNKHALKMLAYISEPKAVQNAISAADGSAAAIAAAKDISTYAPADKIVHLDSSEFEGWDIMRDNGPLQTSYKQPNTGNANAGNRANDYNLNGANGVTV